MCAIALQGSFRGATRIRAGGGWAASRTGNTDRKGKEGWRVRIEGRGRGMVVMAAGKRMRRPITPACTRLILICILIAVADNWRFRFHVNPPSSPVVCFTTGHPRSCGWRGGGRRRRRRKKEQPLARRCPRVLDVGASFLRGRKFAPGIPAYACDNEAAGEGAERGTGKVPRQRCSPLPIP